MPALGFLDDLYFMALTVLMEAGGEIPLGKLAVAWAIHNRCVNQNISVTDACLRAKQFSAWNTDSPTRMNLDSAEMAPWRESYKAACSAYFELGPDPTNGADHYLNEELTKKINNGQLPSWFDEAKVTARIQRHTFLKL
jgi:hypothetical protein